MTERQQRFCEFYAQNPNATQAAISAGFSAKTAYSSGERLLKNVEIQKHIAEITAPEQGQRIADALEVQTVWSDILRDEKSRPCDRLQAGKLLFAAMAGTAQAVGSDADIVDEVDEDEGEIVYLPFNGRVDITAIIAPDGSFVPMPGHLNDDVYTYLPDDAEQILRYRIWKVTNGNVDIEGMIEPYRSEVLSKYQNGGLINAKTE